MHYVFITGGVSSSLGKGLASAALASILQFHGFKVRLRKLDPYLNVDPGTMSPYQHGEVFVTEDGAETDLDLGHYERFTNVDSKKTDTISTGGIYSNVLKKERRGQYLGATIQVIPHVTDEIKKFILSDLTNEDFILCEIGGTVGDIESLPFLEAIRQLNNDKKNISSAIIHVTHVPWLKSAGELKTKPTQHSVKELLTVGIQPDILLCRADREINKELKNKISLFCNVNTNRVISALDAKTIYEVPLMYHKEGLDREILKYFNIKKSKKKFSLIKWKNVVNNYNNPSKFISIAIVGKYTNLQDSYKSLVEAITHGGLANYTKVKIKWINAEDFEKNNNNKIFGDVSGILVPGGFGERGIEGKIRSIKFARKNNIPFLGICLGMQLAVIEISRNVLKLKDSNSTEFAQTSNPVICLMTEWKKNNVRIKRTNSSDKGGTMRLGSYPCNISKGSLVHKIYSSLSINERHRHRYEVNINYIKSFNEKGFVFSGMSPDNHLPEIIESVEHPWFLGVQFHPELKSRPLNPHPLFVSFVEACINKKNA